MTEGSLFMSLYSTLRSRWGSLLKPTPVITASFGIWLWKPHNHASQSCTVWEVSLRKQKDEVYFENTLTWGIVTVFWFYQASHAALYLQYWHYCIIYYTKDGADFTTDGLLDATSSQSRWSSPLRLPPPWGSFWRLLLPTQGKIFRHSPRKRLNTHKQT